MGKELTTGQYLGKKRFQHQFINNIIITQSDYHPNIDLPLHYHNNLILGFVLDGWYTEKVGSKVTNCLQNSVIFQRPRIEHQNSFLQQPATCFNIELIPTWLEKIFAGNISLPDWMICQNAYLSSLIYKINREIHNQDNLTALMLETIIIDLLVNICRVNEDKKTRIPDKIRRIHQKLDEEFFMNHTLQQLSTYIGSDPIFLSRQFKKYFHKTIADYIREKRIENACMLLKNPGMPVSDIAYKCGFSDPSHFIRSFRKVLGVTPNVYRSSV